MGCASQRVILIALKSVPRMFMFAHVYIFMSVQLYWIYEVTDSAASAFLGLPYDPGLGVI